jgi:hypothetical protein
VNWIDWVVLIWAIVTGWFLFEIYRGWKDVIKDEEKTEEDEIYDGETTERV